jgi:hypothetical protein
MEILYLNQCIWRQNLDTNSEFFIYYPEFRHRFPSLILKTDFFVLRNTCKEQKKRMTEVAKQDSNTSKVFLNPTKCQTVSF